MDTDQQQPIGNSGNKFQIVLLRIFWGTFVFSLFFQMNMLQKLSKSTPSLNSILNIHHIQSYHQLHNNNIINPTNLNPKPHPNQPHPKKMSQISPQLPIHHKSDNLESVTVLLIFLIIVINQIFLITLIVVLLKKIKFILKSAAKKYYYFVGFYIVSKLALCVYLQVKIATAIPDQFKEIQSKTIQKVFDSSLAFADCSMAQLFLVSFQHYIALSFSVFGSKRTQKLIRYLMKMVQLIIFFTMVCPIMLFNFSVIEYITLNAFTMSVNLLSVIVFIASFFYMNFKMTGLMMDRRSSQVIKKVYALLLALLVSRLIMSAVEVWVQINLTNGSFEDFITIIEENQNQYVVLGFCFIVYLLVVLLSEGLPIIMSLRQSVVNALVEAVKIPSRPVSFQDSVITQSNSDIKEQLLSNLDMSAAAQQRTSNSIPETYHGVSKIQNPQQLEVVQKILAVKQDFISFKAKWTRTNKFYFVKRMKNISNYIVEQILNQIDFYKKLDTKVINPIKVLKKDNESQIYLIEKYLPENLFIKMDKLVPMPIKTKIDFCIKLAKAIEEFHKVAKTGHGVLNPKNIMFDSDENIVLTGFGMESLKKYLSLTTEYSNLTMYTAVELLGPARQKRITKPNKPADIYSFGIIFYELITGNFKYRNLSITQIRNKFQKQNTRPKIPDEIEQQIKKLMRKCWSQNPEKRPTIEELIKNLENLKTT